MGDWTVGPVGVVGGGGGTITGAGAGAGPGAGCSVGARVAGRFFLGRLQVTFFFLRRAV